MSLFFLELNPVQQIMSQVTSQKSMIDNHHTSIGNIVQQVVSQGWEGTDATQFQQEVQKRILPAIAELALAFAGINANLSGAVDAVNQADDQVNSAVGELAGQWQGI